jgi:hypothetical protein
LDGICLHLEGKRSIQLSHGRTLGYSIHSTVCYATSPRSTSLEILGVFGATSTVGTVKPTPTRSASSGRRPNSNSIASTFLRRKNSCRLWNRNSKKQAEHAPLLQLPRSNAARIGLRVPRYSRNYGPTRGAVCGEMGESLSLDRELRSANTAACALPRRPVGQDGPYAENHTRKRRETARTSTDGKGSQFVSRRLSSAVERRCNNHAWHRYAAGRSFRATLGDHSSQR